MVRVEVYGKADCPLCDEAKAVLTQLKKDLPFDLVEVDITLDPEVHAKYRFDVPVIFVDGRKAFKHRVSLKDARKRIERALVLTEGAEAGDIPPIPVRTMRQVKVGFMVVALVTLPAVLAIKAWDVLVDQPRLAEQAFEIRRLPNPKPAPAVESPMLDGKAWSAAQDRGKVLFVNFWATWCEPCKDEMPSMVQLARQLEAEYPGKFSMVAISIDEGWDPVKTFFAGPMPPVLRLTLDDKEQVATKAYYCAAREKCPPEFKVPESYIVDKEGNLVAYVVGPRDWSQPVARRFLEELIER
jgi:thiol-disulfide isomerase/thioredoxin